jgi:hypothetical protein
MTEPGMYMSYAAHMGEEQTAQEAPSELEREERRLERLRLVAPVWPLPDRFEDEDDGPTAA